MPRRVEEKKTVDEGIMIDADMQQIEFGIQPDILVMQTEEDSRRDRDTLIESARAILTSDI